MSSISSICQFLGNTPDLWTRPLQSKHHNAKEEK